MLSIAIAATTTTHFAAALADVAAGTTLTLAYTQKNDDGDIVGTATVTLTLVAAA